MQNSLSLVGNYTNNIFIIIKKCKKKMYRAVYYCQQYIEICVKLKYNYIKKTNKKSFKYTYSNIVTSLW